MFKKYIYSAFLFFHYISVFFASEDRPGLWDKEQGVQHAKKSPMLSDGYVVIFK